MCAVAGPHPHTCKHAKQIHVIKFSKACIYLWVAETKPLTEEKVCLTHSWRVQSTVAGMEVGTWRLVYCILHLEAKGYECPCPVPFILFIQSRTPACTMVKANLLFSVKLSRFLTDMTRFCFHGDSKSHKLTATANHPNFVYHCSLVPEGGSDT